MASREASPVLRELSRATAEGADVLGRGGTALDAVERSVYLLEESGTFNAGRGACLTASRTVELEAGLCRGSDRATASVLRVTDDLHPISLARFLLERTDMVSMHGDALEALMERGSPRPRTDLVTADKRRRWEALAKAVERRGSFVRNIHPKTFPFVLDSLKRLGVERHGTVGAVAIDTSGDVAAANSTGGHWMKLPGRIGDSPIFGAGYYADPNGAAAATGVGEHMVRSLLCRTIVERMAERGAQTAVRAGFRDLEAMLGGDNAGVIAVDARYRIGIWHNTLGMAHAYQSSSMRAPTARSGVPRRPRKP